MLVLSSAMFMVVLVLYFSWMVVFPDSTLMIIMTLITMPMVVSYTEMVE